MPTEITDEALVRLSFDNRQFEQNAKTTIKTLEELNDKMRLDTKSISDDLKDVEKAVSKVDMTKLSTSFESVSVKFSASATVIKRVLEDITDTVYAKTVQIGKALTIDQYMDGFKEYENKMESLQIILANVRSKGLELKDVETVLDELNTYADNTVYNFAQMTKNIGTFTASGVDLYRSADAIKGIGNLAATAGSSVQQMNNAMYQLSQALAAGTVKLADWNSVVNANMGGTIFQDALKATAREYGKNVDDIIASTGSFRDSLSKGWLDAEVLTTTLKKFTVEGAREYSNEMLLAGKYTEDEAKALMETAEMMEANATHIRTITALIDGLKEASGSGWAKTWEILVGDMNQAENVLTMIGDKLSKFIEVTANVRNNFLEKVMGKPASWENFINEVNKAGMSEEKFVSRIEDMIRRTKGEDGLKALIDEYGGIKEAFDAGAISANVMKRVFNRMGLDAKNTAVSTEDLNAKLDYFNEVVQKVWRGDYGNQDPDQRMKALTAANYDYEQVQELVNIAENGRLLTLEDLDRAQLTAIGYTQEEIDTLEALSEQAKTTGTRLDELIYMMGKPSGRELIVDSIKNVLENISNILKSVKMGWEETFGESTGLMIYKVLESINDATKALMLNEGQLEGIKNTFKGLFAIVDIVRIIFVRLASIADAVFRGIFHEGIKDVFKLTGGLGDFLTKIRDIIKNFDTTLDLTNKVTRAFDALDSAFEHIFSKDLKESGKWIVEGLAEGILNGIIWVKDAIITLAGTLTGVFASEMEIHSPSKVFIAFGGFIVAGLIIGILQKMGMLSNIGADMSNGIIDGFGLGVSDSQKAIDKNVGIFFKYLLTSTKAAFSGFSKSLNKLGEAISDGLSDGITRLSETLSEPVSNLISTFGTLFNNVLNFIKNLNISDAIMDIFAIAIFKFVKDFSTRLMDQIDMLQGPLEKVGEMFEGIAEVFVGMGKTFSDIGKYFKSKAMVEFALAIAILVGTILTMTLLVQSGKVSVVALLGMTALLTALAGVMVGLMALIGLLPKDKQYVSKVFSMILLAESLVIMARALTKLSKIDADEIGKSIIALIACVGSLGLLMDLLGAKEAKISHTATSVLLLSIAMQALAGLVAIASMMPPAMINLGTRNLSKMALLFGEFMAMEKIFAVKTKNGEKNTTGNNILKMTISLGLMLLFVKKAAELESSTIANAIKNMTLINIIFVEFALIGAIGNYTSSGTDVGSVILKMTVSIALLTGVIYILGKMNPSILSKGMLVVSMLSVIFGGIILVLSNIMSDVSSVGNVLIKFAISIGILAAVVTVLGIIPQQYLSNGLKVVLSLGVMIAALVAVTHLAQDCMSTIISITALISILSVTLIAIGLLCMNERIRNGMNEGIKLMGALSVLISGIIAASKFAGEIKIKDMLKIALGLGVLSFVLIGVAEAMSILNTKADIPTVTAACELTVAICAGAYLITKASRLVKTNKLLSVVPLLIAMMGILLISIAALSTLKGVDLSDSLPQLLALETVIITMCLSARELVKASKGVNVKSLLGTGALIGAMGGVLILAALALNIIRDKDIDATNLLPQVLALSLLMLALTSCIKIIGSNNVYISKKKIAGLSATFAVLGAVMIMAADALDIAKDVKPSSALSSAAAISIMMTAMIGLAVLFTKGIHGLTWTNNMKSTGILLITIASLGVLMVGIAEFFNLVETLNLNPSYDLKMGGVITAELLALSTIATVMSKVVNGMTWGNNMKSIGIVLITITSLEALMIGIGGVFKALEAMQLNPAQDMGVALLITAELAVLTTLALGIYAVTTALPGLGTDFIAKLKNLAVVGIAILGLEALMIPLAYITKLIGSLDINTSDTIPKITMVVLTLAALSALAVGISVLSGIAATNIVGIAVTAALIGVLALIMYKLSELFIAMKDIDADNMAKQLTSIAKLMGLLAVVLVAVGLIGLIVTGTGGAAALFVLVGIATVLGAIFVSLLGLGATLKAFNALGLDAEMKQSAEALSAFANALLLLGQLAQTIDTSAVAGIKNIKDMIEELTKIKFSSLIGSLFSDVSIDETVSDLVKMALGLSMFSRILKLGGFDDQLVTSATIAGEAAFALLGKTRDGGIVGLWKNLVLGKLDPNNIDEMNDCLVKIAVGLVRFSQILSLGKFDDQLVTSAAKSTEMLQKVVDSMRSGIFDKLKDFVFGSVDIESFESDIVKIAHALVAFSQALNSNEFDATSVTAASMAIDAIGALYDGLPKTGGKLNLSELKSALFGDVDVDKLKKDLTAMGEGMTALFTSLNSVPIEGEDFGAKITATCDIIKALAEAQDTIGNSGGVLGDILGNNDINDFASRLAETGEGIVALTNVLTGQHTSENSAELAHYANSKPFEMNKQLILDFADCINAIAKAAAGIGNEGGALGALLGDNLIDVWGQRLPAFGQGFRDFYDTLPSTIDTKLVKDACEAAQAIANIDLPTVGGIVSWFVDKMDIGDFGTALGVFGEGLAKFINILSTVNTDLLPQITEFVRNLNDLFEAINDFTSSDAFKALQKAIGDGTNGKLPKFIKNFGNFIQTFSDSIENVAVDRVNAASEAMAHMFAAMKDYTAFTDFDGKQMTTVLDTMSSESVDKFCTAFEDSKEQVDASVTTFTNNVTSAIDGNGLAFFTSGRGIVNDICGGMTDSVANNKLLNAMSSISTQIEAATKATEVMDKLTSSGENIIRGIVNGMESSTSKGLLSDAFSKIQNGGSEIVGNTTSGKGLSGLANAMSGSNYSGMNTAEIANALSAKNFNVDATAVIDDDAASLMGDSVADSLSPKFDDITASIEGLDTGLNIGTLNVNETSPVVSDVIKRFQNAR